MNVIVRYSNGVSMSYSVNTFMPIEGYRVAFNGTKGRFEICDFERQAWDAGTDTEMYLIHNFGKRERIEPKGLNTGGHGGGEHAAAGLCIPQGRRAGAHGAAELPGRSDGVPHRYRRAHEHRREAADPGRRPRAHHLTSPRRGTMRPPHG